LRALRGCGRDDQGRGHDREFGEEVQLGQPGSIEAKAVAVLNLSQGIIITLALGLPWSTGQLKEKPEFHDHAPLDGDCALPRNVVASMIAMRRWGRF
jgi:hypothetical protein